MKAGSLKNKSVKMGSTFASVPNIQVRHSGAFQMFVSLFSHETKGQLLQLCLPHLFLLTVESEGFPTFEEDFLWGGLQQSSERLCLECLPHITVPEFTSCPLFQFLPLAKHPLGGSRWISATHKGDLHLVPSFWIQPGPVPTVTGYLASEPIGRK